MRHLLASSLLALLVAVLLSAGAVRAADRAVTWSFAAGDKGTCPRTITVTGAKLTINVSALPKGADVSRAVLRCRRRDYRPSQRPADKVVVVASDKPDAPLPLLAPRYAALDARDILVPELVVGNVDPGG